MDKSVWRLNTGVEPKDKTESVVFHGNCMSVYNGSDWNWSIEDRDYFDIYAYQTNRTRKAKYYLEELDEVGNE